MTEQPEPFRDPRMKSGDKIALEQFWIDRYRNAPAIKDPAVAAMDRSDGPKSGHSAGGEGFCKALPTKEALDAHLAQRRQELAMPGQLQDKERLGLLMKAEETCWEGHRAQRPSEAHRALADLVTYDRANGHPVADPARDLKAQPYSDVERRDWLTRDGRKASPDEVKWSNDNLFDTAKPDPSIKAPNPGSAEQPWWMDAGTAQRVGNRPLPRNDGPAPEGQKPEGLKPEGPAPEGFKKSPGYHIKPCGPKL